MALGVGVIVEHFVVLFTTIVGALYPVFRGIQAIRHRTDLPAENAQSRRPRNPGRMIAAWFVVAVSNLKTIVFLVAVLPQLVEYSRVNIALQLAILGAVFSVPSSWCRLRGDRTPERQRLGSRGRLGARLVHPLSSSRRQARRHKRGHDDRAGTVLLFVGSSSE